ncbi:hypothetical protein ANCCAN_09958, partial [Ancylostoma caninum]
MTHLSKPAQRDALLDTSYITLSPVGVAVAYAYLRKKCLHIGNYLHQAIPVAHREPHPPRHREQPFNLEELIPAAFSHHAISLDWTTSKWHTLDKKKVVVCLPEGFENHAALFTRRHQVAYAYTGPLDFQESWFSGEISAIVLFSPTQSASAEDWYRVWRWLIRCVAHGTDLFCLPGPRDDANWEFGVDFLRDFIDETLVQRPSLKNRIHDLLPFPSERDADTPFNVIGIRRTNPRRVYTECAAKRFLNFTAQFYRPCIVLEEYRRTPRPPRPVRDEPPRQAGQNQQEAQGPPTSRPPQDEPPRRALPYWNRRHFRGTSRVYQNVYPVRQQRQDQQYRYGRPDFRGSNEGRAYPHPEMRDRSPPRHRARSPWRRPPYRGAFPSRCIMEEDRIQGLDSPLDGHGDDSPNDGAASPPPPQAQQEQEPMETVQQDPAPQPEEHRPAPVRRQVRPPPRHERVSREDRWASIVPPDDLVQVVTAIVDELLPVAPVRAASSANIPQDNILLMLKEVLKSQSIADVKKFDGKRPLTDFIRELDVKYPATVWSDVDRRNILLNHLEGSAKAYADNLPAEIRNGSFDGLAAELRKLNHTPCERLKARSEWRALRKFDNESISDFCCRLQRLAKQVFPHSCNDFEMGCKLYECLADWTDSYYMLSALDAPEGRIFEEVRRAALRLERTREATSSTASKPWKPRTGKAKAATQDSPVRQRGRPATDSAKQRQPLGAAGPLPEDSSSRHQHQRRQGLSRLQEGPSQTSKRQAPKAKPTTGIPSSKQEKGSLRSFSTHLESWCCSVGQAPAIAMTPAVGEPCHCDIRIFGMQAKALIDSGSVITIIPLGLLKKAKNQGIDLNKMVTMLDDSGKAQVYDASGNPMSFLMLIAASIEVKGGSSAKVQMHIHKSESNIILLGTNALNALGIQIRVEPCVKQSRSRRCKAKRKQKRASPPATQLVASATRRVVIPPFASADIELSAPATGTDHVFLSDDDRIASAVCRVTKGSATLSVVNKGPEPWVIQKGHPLGKWTRDQWYDPKTSDIPGDMLEIRRAALPSREEKLRLLIETLKHNKQS